MGVTRVLHVGLWNNPGGIENCILNYAKHIDTSRYVFDFADLNGEGIYYEKEFEALGGRIFHFGNYKKNPPKAIANLRNLILKRHYKIVHIHMLSAANIIPVLAAKDIPGIKVIVHSHNTVLPSGNLRKTLHKANLKFLRSQNVEKWACSRVAGKWLWGKSFSRENVIPNAVETRLFTRDNEVRTALRNELGFEEDTICLGFVGRLSEQKNPLFFPELFLELASLDERYRFLIVGDGPYRTAFETKLRYYDIEDRVIFTGNVDSAIPYYQAMDGFLLPSLFEGLPVVGVEAQAANLPCFFSNRITRESAVGGMVSFLPIIQGVTPWVSRIEEFFNNTNTDITQNNYLIPRYDINLASLELMLKYDKLL